MNDYYRPLVRFDLPRPDHALCVAGGAGWFSQAVLHRRSENSQTIVELDQVPDDWRMLISSPRQPIAGVTLDQPRIMGILNVTPDSFSDGGSHASPARALSHAEAMVAEGADILDIGGESTRPGAELVPAEAEIARIEPVIHAIRHKLPVPISIDTRKSRVAEAAYEVGASIINDVSGFTYDRMLSHFCASHNLPVCVMHSQGTPETMQDDPHYEDVLLDVFDFLNAQIAMLGDLGISRDQIIVDPGIGFGKSLQHNLALLNGISLFHALGCPILLGASRKGFIRKITGAVPASARMPGSIAAAMAAVHQGVQIVRVHDVADTSQALQVWQAICKGEHFET
ncbi:dihydropteroate synthase [Tropicibacter sp. R15_0]|uniref:dihydropteroate synthase n=1 Tax=Tropicibacter sp. R15_0 TaxID=2821101 RepID=UPI001AD976AC|nr:dihydropteroate synthase [Tropicibacter sp. R15_0]MBO9466144.1 dihydropteroate synthase [Tropicibacter sp. R15_0]